MSIMNILQIIWEILTYSHEGVDQAILPLAIPLIMAGIGVGSKVVSGIKGGNEMDKYQDSLTQEKAGMEAWYNTEKNRDFMESDIARAAMNKVLENVQDQNKITESAAEVTGASDASVIASKAKTQKQFGNVVKDLASYGTQRRDKVEYTNMNNMSRMSELNRDLYSGRAQNAATLGSAGGDLIGAAGGLMGQTKWAAGLESYIDSDDASTFGSTAQTASNTFSNTVNR